MKERQSVILLIMIMMTACLLVAGVTMSILYKTALKEEEDRLMVTAQSQARLIEAVARFDTVYSRSYPGGAKAATLDQIIDAHKHYSGFGKTGEFTLSKKEGDHIVFLLSHRHQDLDNPKPVPYESDLAEPMRRALSGQSGTVIGRDYHGHMVLAAHEPLAGLDLGIVAKIDLSEVREPFVRSGLIGLCFTVLIVLISTRFFTRITNPIIRRVEKRAFEMEKLNEEMEDEIREREKAEKALRKSENELKIRNKISDTFLKFSDDNVFPEVLNIVMEAMKSKKGYFGYIDQNGALACPSMTRDIWDQCMIPDKTIVFPRDSWGGLWGKSLIEKKTFYLNDSLSVPHGHIPLNNAMAVPIILQNELIGQIVVADRESDFDEKDQHLLEKIANSMGPVLKARIKLAINERKQLQAEENLKRAYDELERQVEERTAALSKMNEILKTEIKVRKEIQALLEKNEKLLQMVLDGISDPLVLLDENLKVKILNNAALRYYQKGKKGIINRCCYQAFRGKSEPCEGCRIPKAVKSRQSIFYERFSPKDHDRLEQVNVYKLDKKDNRSGGAIIRIHDITESRLVEREMIHAEKLASLGLMVSCITHEITNPISTITFNAPILKDYINAMIPIIDDYAKERQDFELFRLPYPQFRKDADKIMTNIINGSKRVEVIVDNLRKIYKGKEEQERQWLNLKSVIENTVSFVWIDISRYVKSFGINIPEEFPEIYAVPDSIEQILINLLTNAAHASDKEDSYIKLEVKMGHTWQDHLIIEVGDNGCGMDKETQLKIFNPFYSTKPPDQGTGLGLFVCQNLIQKLDGRIEVQSEVGRGSIFRVILPDVERRSMKRL